MVHGGGSCRGAHEVKYRGPDHPDGHYYVRIMLLLCNHYAIIMYNYSV